MTMPVARPVAPTAHDPHDPHDDHDIRDTALPSPDGDTRLTGRRLVVARVLTFVVIGGILALYAIALRGLYPRIATPCADPLNDCLVSPEQAVALARLGFTPATVADITIGLTYAAVVLVIVVAAVPLWRRSDDWMALFLALVLILLPANYTGIMRGLPDGLSGLGEFVASLSNSALYLLLAIFPNGRFVPRWLWVPALLLIAILVIPFPDPSPDVPAAAFELISAVTGLLAPLLELILIGAQVYRYRRVATPTQRQQIKWGVYGLVLTIIVNQGFWIPVILDPDLQAQDSLYILFAVVDSFAMIVILAVAFSIAILRFRLYDIDVIVNRALVYGSLTAILAAVYIAGVVGSQAIVGSITHTSGQEQSAPSIVITTLIVAALFQPLRTRIQRSIDRRFYRQKYDATRTLAAFAATLRERVDMRDLSDHLLAVVEETMQPEHVSLWLRQTITSVPNADDRTLSPDERVPYSLIDTGRLKESSVLR